MTKKSIIERNKKRIFLNNKFNKKIKELKKIIKGINFSKNDKWNAMINFQKLPRNSFKSRIRNRCYITGRSRSYFRRFGLSKVKLREMAVLGYIPGLKKSSW